MEKTTIQLDTKKYERFRDYCKEKGHVIKTQIERFMDRFVDEGGDGK